jgi:hypothetical protein
MLSCSSIKASIWGLAVSWKYKPQGLGTSHVLCHVSNILDLYIVLCIVSKVLEIL